ncbi:MAG: stealth family protein [Balneolaceae bacterium]
MNRPIDAVVTWVDGNDEAHIERKNRIREQEPDKEYDIPTGHISTRFVDNGELNYCLRLIRQFAPWIRTIHLVTDNQRPDFLTSSLQKKLKVRIVDHSEIFESCEWALPTFNSRTIETALHRIPGIAERFIYFNDDILLTAPIPPERFFFNDSVVLRGRWNYASAFSNMRVRLNNWLNAMAYRYFGITRSMHHLLQIRSARLAGFRNRYFRIPHIPHPVRTETIRVFFRQHPELFEQNIQYRFRNMDQFSTIYLANHMEIRRGRAILKKARDHLMINCETDFQYQIRQKLNRIQQGKTRCLCIQGLERLNPVLKRELTETLENLIGDESPTP